MVTSPRSVDLTFSEAVAASSLSVSLVMTSMPGMTNHKPMTIKGFAVEVSGEHATLRFPRPLPSGAYRLEWTLAREPADRTTGTLVFEVR
jgi:hypothetical protein